MNLGPVIARCFDGGVKKLVNDPADVVRQEIRDDPLLAVLVVAGVGQEELHALTVRLGLDAGDELLPVHARDPRHRQSDGDGRAGGE